MTSPINFMTSLTEHDNNLSKYCPTVATELKVTFTTYPTIWVLILVELLLKSHGAVAISQETANIPLNIGLFIDKPKC